MANSIVRPGAPDAFHSTPGMTDYVDPMGPMTQGPALVLAPTPTAYANDPVYDRAVNTINTGLAQATAGRDTSTRRINEDYTTNVDTARKNNGINMSALQNRLANQGIGYSGINVSEQGKLSENLTEQITALTTGKTRGLEDVATDYANRQAGYQDQLGQAEVDKGARETERQKQIAADEAQAAAANEFANTQRQWIGDITKTLTSLAQPQATPTGQMQLANPNPQAIVQQAIKQLPPPAIPAAPPDMIRNVQDELKHQGFDIGPTDGIVGKRTLTAYNQWRANLNLPPVGRITMDDINLLASTPGVQPQMAGMNMGGVPGARLGGNQA